MADIKQQQYQSIVSAMTTELNSLANGSRAISSALGGDTTDADLMDDWELFIDDFGGVPTVDAPIGLYLVRSADGTNYEDGDATLVPKADAFVGNFTTRAADADHRLVLRDIPRPPGLFKAVVHNQCGQAFGSSGNTLKARPHSYQSV